jgi:hypothetical protein
VQNMCGHKGQRLGGLRIVGTRVSNHAHFLMVDNVS